MIGTSSLAMNDNVESYICGSEVEADFCYDTYNERNGTYANGAVGLVFSCVGGEGLAFTA